jgi:hypothetical protein
MQLSEVYTALGEERFRELLRGISMGKLRTYQLFERLQVRCRLNKLNTEHLRKAAPRLWERLDAKDEELAQDLAQAVLIGQMDMIVAALDVLGIPHESGFFSKDIDPKQYLNGDWQEKVYAQLKDRFPRGALVFYLNHLAVESGVASAAYLPAA